MIKWSRTIVVFLLLIAGCTGHNPLLNDSAVTVTALAGSPLTDVVVEKQGASLQVEVGAVPAEGMFFRIDSETPLNITGQEWTGTDGLLYLATSSCAGIDIGLVPVGDYSGGRVKVNLQTGRTERQVATPPWGEKNAVQDLKIQSAGGGNYSLTWTEVNVGDYNVDGYVLVSDLTPVGMLYDQRIEQGEQYYWVDGNSNGLIEVSDITPIGVNYESNIAGYVVWRNDEPVTSSEGDGVTVVARPATSLSLGPPTYEVELPGEAGDEWFVTPVDHQYPASAVGSISNPVISEGGITDPELEVDLHVSGIELFNVESKSSDTINDGFQILRIIDPGEIVHNMSIEERMAITPVGRIEIDGSFAKFDQLPRGVPLYLEVLYAAKEDLNGIPRFFDEDDTDEQILEECPNFFDVAAIPFEIPEGDLVDPLCILGSILFEKEGEVGWNVVSVYEYIADGKPEEATGVMQRLDYPAGMIRVAMNSYSISEVVALSDTDRDGVSDRQLEMDLDDIDWGEPWGEDQILTANIGPDFDLNSGSLLLENVTLDPDGTPFPVGVYTIYFSERTLFGLIGSDTSLKDPQQIDASTIDGGEAVRVRFNRYTGSADVTGKLWADRICFVVDPKDD